MSLIILSMEILVMLDTTKRSSPTGGVMHPMARFTTMSTPKKTGSMPSCRTTGSRMGVGMAYRRQGR